MVAIVCFVAKFNFILSYCTVYLIVIYDFDLSDMAKRWSSSGSVLGRGEDGKSDMAHEHCHFAVAYVFVVISYSAVKQTHIILKQQIILRYTSMKLFEPVSRIGDFFSCDEFLFVFSIERKP